MYVAASCNCFPDEPFSTVLERLVDLQFSSIEIDIHETGGHMKPSQVHADLNAAIEFCRDTRRLSICAFSVEIQTDDKQEYLRQFASCCKLAKAHRVVLMIVPGAELGTPFNEEVERLREMVAIAAMEGVVVTVRNETGKVTEDPDTTKVFCDTVQGLGVTLDPSHFIYGQKQPRSYDHIMSYVRHVHLRDTSQDQLQVRVGQGSVEYGRLITQLGKVGYDRALTVNMAPIEGYDQMAEMRKMRLLLESLLM